MKFKCQECSSIYPLNGLKYQCDCGGLFQLLKEPGEKVNCTVSLGEVETPVLNRMITGINFALKLDYMMPTGSFKDRGAYILVNQLKELGIKEVVEDSSGNAGSAIAAYCAAAGIKCHIYLPESTSPGKIKQINAYNAAVVKVPGSRDDTAKAIKKAAEHTYYASHVYNPLFFEGTKSIAYEIYNQIGVPDYIVVPVGNGTMLLGVYNGFAEIGILPRIIAVQSENCAPIYNKVAKQEGYRYQPTVAEGIAVQTPMRIDEIIAAVQKSDGKFVTVTDEQVISAQSILNSMGIYVEPTAGAALAGGIHYFKNGYNPDLKIVVPLTGTGLKK